MATVLRTPKDAERFLKQAASILSKQRVDAPESPLQNTNRFLLRVGLASLTLGANGRVMIAGPATDADSLCRQLSEAGLLQGWSSGSRGDGITWAPVLDVEETTAWLLRLFKATMRANRAEDALGTALYFTIADDTKTGARMLAQRLVDSGLTRLDAVEATRLLGFDMPPEGGEVAMTSNFGWLRLELVGTTLKLVSTQAGVSPEKFLEGMRTGIELHPCHIASIRNMFAPSTK